MCASNTCDNDDKCGLENGTSTGGGTPSVVCRAGVADADGSCGLANGTSTGGGTPSVVCRAGVADTDNKCGLSNGDGPCTVATGAAVCRSGTCGAGSLKCVPTGGCDLDSDCTGGKWCDVAAMTCNAKLSNGSNLPADAGHTNPTLNGTCSAQAGALVCSSGVCDTKDNKCGIASGDGACTTANGPTVCRSGVCSVTGVCEAMGNCLADGDCAANQWCEVSLLTCESKLPNGTGIPTDPAHTNPALNGKCSAQAGTLVCTSGVCDTADNACGLENGTPTGGGAPSVVCRSGVADADAKCGFANGTPRGTGAASVVCRAGVADTDNKCGLSNGDGPCTVATGAAVCRSGTCGATSLACVPANGCAADSDCAAGQWCDVALLTCEAKLTNGTAVPTDAGHTTPTLNGKCSVTVGALVCASGVCDTKDNKCGIANGDGACSGATAAQVCRSGNCGSVSLDCVPTNGCVVDADCAAGQWCDVALLTCQAKLTNGTAVPTDAGHANPTLNGTCSAAAGALVCVSGACDTSDNKCGLANGDGPCLGGEVCRSGTCSAAGKCIAPATCAADADCAAGFWCDISTATCDAKLPNGSGIPTDAAHTNPSLNGTCNAQVGTLVCASGVCDTKDNKCGIANGDGTCSLATGAATCRSGDCSINGTCIPAGGCTADADCLGGQWCDVALDVCEAKLTNGTPIPTDAGHTNPNAQRHVRRAGRYARVLEQRLRHQRQRMRLRQRHADRWRYCRGRVPRGDRRPGRSVRSREW